MNFLQKKLKIIGICLFFIFIFPSQNFWDSGQCDTTHIAYIFAKFETNYSKDFDQDEFKELLIPRIESFSLELWATKSIEGAKKLFKERQDKKFQLALEYFYENFEAEWKNFDSEDGGPTPWAREKLDELWTMDFFVANDMKEPKSGFIPSKTLFRSMLLDWMIYSCYLSDQIWNFNPSWEKELSAILKSERISSEMINEEIKKQKDVLKYVVLKYQSFLDNYLIHKQLESIIFYLDKLRTRMADLASIIWFLPAKVVNFGS